MDKIVGQLMFFTRVELVQDSKIIRKRVRLGSIWCAQPECNEKLEEFRGLNYWVKPSEIFAEFVYREYL
jgi:hypothetical protein